MVGIALRTVKQNFDNFANAYFVQQNTNSP